MQLNRGRSRSCEEGRGSDRARVKEVSKRVWGGGDKTEGQGEGKAENGIRGGRQG